ncbi:hypothetical protein EFK50_14170 [Nocardioides marmoriginsengisoli]|uniref:Amidase domain-containing protein n=1 Tax=Nocardioides marmoriginsengisoli TaxID=661483 RepID=A0A3N0CHE8_9ACTN|nr:hypothetical protein EFK50_14170 [Nocardioides marmoriginsengisoli]
MNHIVAGCRDQQPRGWVVRIQDLSRIDAIGQAHLVRSGQVAPHDLVEAAIDRIAAVDPELNSIVTQLFDKARREAGAVDLEAPFAGVPYVLKDHLTGSAGDPMSEGLAPLREQGWAPDTDSFYVERMRQAGFVLIGKSNLPELALRATTESATLGHATTRGMSPDPRVVPAADQVPQWQQVWCRWHTRPTPGDRFASLQA